MTRAEGVFSSIYRTLLELESVRLGWDICFVDELWEVLGPVG